MIQLDTALAHVCRTVAPFPVESLPLRQSFGLTLAADVVSDIDSPPFDKSLMDGYAVRVEDVGGGTAALFVTESITAGQVPLRAVLPGTAIQVMTGAPLPSGTTAVIKMEETILSGNQLRFSGRPVAAEANLIRRGAAFRCGETILRAGDCLTASRIGALAEMGHALAPVRRRPRIAVLATGDELVPVDTVPGPGQIRNSNESMLVAQIQNCGGEPVPLGASRDNRDELAGKIRAGLQHDILVLSGGVSAGKLDLVPAALEAAGVREIFHKVHLKPGKPVWFGQTASPSGGCGCAVFGLPGNPVSSMVCFELFVRAAVRKLMGVEPAMPTTMPAQLTADFRHRSDRPTCHPAELRWTNSGLSATILPWQGSSDLQATTAANGMAVLTEGEQDYQAGGTVSVISWGAEIRA